MTRPSLYSLLITLIALIGSGSCSSSTLSWTPDNEEGLFQVIGPLYVDEATESYRNIKVLNLAIAETVNELKRTENKNGTRPYQKLQIINWMLKSKQIEELWELFENKDGESSSLLYDSSFRNRLVEYFEEAEFTGRILAIRIAKGDSDDERILEGIRLIYISDDELDLNRFSIPYDQSSPDVSQKLKTVVKKLISTLEYSSPDFGKMGFVEVNSGCFKLGNRPSDEECLDDYLLGKYPVTKAQWNQIMLDSQPSNLKDYTNPAVGMNWVDLERFLEALNDKSDHSFRLPTGAEWEYACRSGKNDRLYGTETGKPDPNQANFTRFSLGRIPEGIKAVDFYAPNVFGFFDMSGNTWEWTEDRYTVKDQKGLIGRFFDLFSSDTDQRVIRGGSYDSSEREIRCSSEKYIPENIGSTDAGFRLIMEE